MNFSLQKTSDTQTRKSVGLLKGYKRQRKPEVHSCMINTDKFCITHSEGIQLLTVAQQHCCTQYTRSNTHSRQCHSCIENNGRPCGAVVLQCGGLFSFHWWWHGRWVGMTTEIFRNHTPIWQICSHYIYIFKHFVCLIMYVIYVRVRLTKVTNAQNLQINVLGILHILFHIKIWRKFNQICYSFTESKEKGTLIC